MDSIQVLQNKAAKLVLDRATFSSSTQALLDMNWINLSSRRSMQRCLFMHKLINDSERNSMITRGTDYHSHNTRSKENIRSIRSNTNWGLLRSFNSALTDWNSLLEDMRCPPYDAFKISLLTLFESECSFSVSSHVHRFCYFLFISCFRYFIVPTVMLLLINYAIIYFIYC